MYNFSIQIKNILLLLSIVLLLLAGIFGFIPNKSLSLRVSQQIFCEWIVISSVLFFFIKNFWVKMFLIWSFIMSIFGVCGQNQSAYVTFNTLFFYAILYQFLSNKLNENYIEYIYNGLCFICLFQIGLMILQYFDIWFLVAPKTINSDRFSGLLGNSNIAGSFIALCLPAFLRKKWCYLVPVLFIGLLLSKSFGGFIACFCGILTYCWLKFDAKRFFAIFFVLIITCSFYLVKFENLNPKAHEFLLGNRALHWKVISENIIPKHPIKGWGLGQFKHLYPFYQKNSDMYKKVYPYRPEAWFRHAHNEYLQVFVEQGIIGLIIILGFILSIFFHFKNRINLALIGFLIILINSFYHFLFHTTTALIAVLYLAILQFYKNKEISYEENILPA